MNILIFSAIVTIALVSQVSTNQFATLLEDVSVNIKTSLFVDHKCYERWLQISKNDEEKAISTINYVYTEFFLKTKKIIEALSDETYKFNLELTNIFIDSKEPVEMKFIEENLKDGKLRVTGALQAFKKHLKSNEAHQLAVLITCQSPPSSDVKSIRLNDFYKYNSIPVIVFDNGLYQNAGSLAKNIVEALAKGVIVLGNRCGKEEIMQHFKIIKCAMNEVKKEIRKAFQKGERLSIFSAFEHKESLNFNLPPDNLSLNQQCEMFYGEGFVECEKGKKNVCEVLKCCKDELQYEEKALEGTVCGKSQYCYYDRCTSAA